MLTIQPSFTPFEPAGPCTVSPGLAHARTVPLGSVYGCAGLQNRICSESSEFQRAAELGGECKITEVLREERDSVLEQNAESSRSGFYSRQLRTHRCSSGTWGLMY